MMDRKREPWKPLLCNYPNSRKVNQLSYGSETMYTRLLVQVDDKGNYDAEPVLLMSSLFARRVKQGEISVSDTTRMRDELVTVGLACLYEVGEELYLHLNGLFRLVRKDVNLDIRFPEYSETLVVAGLPEAGPTTGPERADDDRATGQGRAEDGPLEERRIDRNIFCARTRMREGKPNWLAVRHRLADLFPNDAGIENFICWLSIRLLPKDRQDVEAVVAILWDLFDKAETKDHPPAWFMGAVKQPVAKGGFAYRPIGRRRTSDV